MPRSQLDRLLEILCSCLPVLGLSGMISLKPKHLKRICKGMFARMQIGEGQMPMLSKAIAVVALSMLSSYARGQDDGNYVGEAPVEEPVEQDDMDAPRTPVVETEEVEPADQGEVGGATEFSE
jgi:hypothetical protein